MTASIVIALLAGTSTASAQWYGDYTDDTYSLSEEYSFEETYTLSETYTLDTASTSVTLSDCQDLDWLNNSASSDEQAACTDLLLAEAQDDIDDADANGELRFRTRVFEDSAGMPDEQDVVRGSIFEEWEHRASYHDTSDVDGRESDYESDGDFISSCEEYGYQRFYDYSLFQSESRAADDKYREIVDTAFDSGFLYAGAIGLQGATGVDFSTREGTVYAEDQFGPGEWTASSSGDYVRPKNTFFDLTDEEIDMIDQIDSSMASVLREGREYWRSAGQAMSSHSAPSASGSVTIDNAWRFHEVQDARISASDSDAMMAFYREKRAAFADVVQHRRQLLADGVSRMDIGDWVYEQQLDETVSGYDAELYSLLQEADALGCLSISTTESDRLGGTYDFHACDWAPQDFHDEVVAQAEQLKAEAVAECESIADFTSLSSGGGYSYYDSTGTLQSASDPRYDVADFRTYLDRTKASEENRVTNAVNNYNVTAFGIPLSSYQWSKGDSYGDTGFFAASWNASVAWNLVDAQAGTICDVDPYFTAGADANVHVFSYKQEVIDATVDFNVRKGRRVVDLEILTYDLIQESWESPGSSTAQRINYTFTKDQTWEHKATLAQADTTFMVWIIPVTVQGGVTGRLGVNYGLKTSLTEVAQSNGCYQLQGTVGAYARPYAALDGKAAMGIGVPGLSAGAYGKLNLAKVSVPTRIEARATAPYDVSNIEFEVESSSKLKLSTLSGELGVYADIFGSRHEKELVRWRGLEYSLDIYKLDYDIDLSVWSGVCSLPDVNCNG